MVQMKVAAELAIKPEIATNAPKLGQEVIIDTLAARGPQGGFIQRLHIERSAANAAAAGAWLSYHEIDSGGACPAVVVKLPSGCKEVEVEVSLSSIFVPLPGGQPKRLLWWEKVPRISSTPLSWRLAVTAAGVPGASTTSLFSAWAHVTEQASCDHERSSPLRVPPCALSELSRECKQMSGQVVTSWLGIEHRAAGCSHSAKSCTARSTAGQLCHRAEHHGKLTSHIIHL